MKVCRLIMILTECCDPDADVFIMQQPNWPIEHAITGVTVRAEFSDLAPDDPTAGDVFILEGRQLAYGSRDAWTAPFRP